MYIKLGNTSIKYQDQDYDDFMIFCQVPTTQLSYYKPVLVRTKNELDIWFGADFPGRDFLDELVSAENTLYLYKPISTEPDKTIPDFIDYSEFPTEGPIYQPDLEELEPVEGVIYQVVEEDGSERDLSGLRWNNYILVEGALEKIQNLPQNLDHINSASTTNRDTLRICWPGVKENLTYCYQRPWDVNEEEESKLKNLSQVDLEKINKEQQTLAFSVGDLRTVIPREDSYIILTTELGTGRIYYFGEDIPADIKGANESAWNKTSKAYYNTSQRVTSMENFLEVIEDIGYHWDEAESVITVDYPVPVTYFYRLPGLVLEPSLPRTHNLLDTLTKGWARIEFKAKTIGTGGPDGKIKVAIEKLDQDYYYRITISRYNYSEVFEGPVIDGTIGSDERLDYQVSKGSKLVECSLIETWTTDEGIEVRYGGDGDTRGIDLIEGEWELGRAVAEVYREENYRAALKKLLQPIGDPVYPDFVLIPDMDLYGGDFNEALLGYCTEANCQALIENTDENYVWNLKSDTTNRLIYFYKGMTINGVEKPGYYMYIIGLLADIYSLTAKNILYYGPVTSSSSSNPYAKDIPELNKYKCNYLVNNGQIYYYKTYQDGEKPETTGWMRFTISKISRELEKNKWEYLGKKMIGSMKSSLLGVLERVKNSFSIIRDITVDNFELDTPNNRIELTITTEISDLVKKSMTVDIVINYNKYNESN